MIFYIFFLTINLNYYWRFFMKTTLKQNIEYIKNVFKLDGMTAEDAVMSGTVNLLINGGTFAGKIIAVQDNSITVTGSVNVTCASAYESKLQGNFTSKVIK